MRILSWDVGIINLAYCLLEQVEIDNKLKYKVYEWGLIDISRKKEQKCFECGKNASQCYFSMNENIEKLCCKVHGRKYKMPELGDYKDYFENKKDLYENCDECDKKAIKYKNNSKYCSSHGRQYFLKLKKSVELRELKKVKTVFDIDILRRNLVEELDKKPELFTAEKVLIENQPSLKNPRMKAISSTIYDYYLIRGIVDKNKNNLNSCINQVKYMSPSNKIKLSKDKQIVKDADKKNKYKLTKKLAVDYVKLLLDDDLNNFKDYFLGVKKKDDLADAFLQGAYYLTKVI